MIWLLSSQRDLFIFWSFYLTDECEFVFSLDILCSGWHLEVIFFGSAEVSCAFEVASSKSLFYFCIKIPCFVIMITNREVYIWAFSYIKEIYLFLGKKILVSPRILQMDKLYCDHWGFSFFWSICLTILYLEIYVWEGRNLFYVCAPRMWCIYGCAHVCKQYVFVILCFVNWQIKAPHY